MNCVSQPPVGPGAWGLESIKIYRYVRTYVRTYAWLHFFCALMYRLRPACLP